MILSKGINQRNGIFQEIDQLKYEQHPIIQEKLDINQKTRQSLFPWRGQFSPQLVEFFLEKYATEKTVILDPFAGSGTTLFEAARKGITCYGTEINPAAVIMAKTVNFTNLSSREKQKITKDAESIIQNALLPFQWNLFAYQQQQEQKINFTTNINETELCQKILAESSCNENLYNCLANVIIRYFSTPEPRQITNLENYLFAHLKIINNLPYSNNLCQVFHGDARSISLTDQTIDLIITSPPYINVFNYHQNHRQAMENMGWDILNIAKSEIGANRKNRQNRFLTVIQYALDMMDTLTEMRRLLQPKGRVIIVIGKQSQIRGLNIENSRLVGAISLGAGFAIDKLQQRKFSNKFGQIIYEDILHLVPDNSRIILGDDFACATAQSLLEETARLATGDILEEVLSAKKRAKTVVKSPLFRL